MDSKVKDFPQNIAHRGFSGIAPENTLIAFKLALDEGVDMIELDVHMTKDSQLVVIHDKSVNRTSNGKGKISELTLEEIKSLDAGSWFDKKYEGEKIPALEEVFMLVNGKAQLFIEVKKGDMPYNGIEKEILAMIEKHNAKSWCIIHSFESETMRNFYRLDSSYTYYKTAFLTSTVIPFYIDKFFRFGNLLEMKFVNGFNLNHQSVSARLVRKLHAKNYRLIAWTVNSPASIRRMISLKVDGIISNFPDRVRKEIEAVSGR